MILVLGGSGYVGAAMRRALTENQLEHQSVSRTECDYTNTATLAALLRTVHPEFLINCAGFTGKPNVDACELHKTECLFANAVLPGNIHTACEAAGIPWGHVSTGCIFTGYEREYAETDTPNFTFRQNNCSFYSGTKALGEELLADAANCYIWRVRIPFNNVDNPHNYLSKLVRYERLLDVRNSLTQLDEFARAALECWQRRIPFGTYHMTNPGSITTSEIIALMKRDAKFYTSETEFMREPGRAPRSNCVLDTGKLQRTGIRMTEVNEAIKQSLRTWRPA